MATITPAYSWPVPTSSDLVKDGATAIEALGDAIDASMNTALGTKKAGMVLLNTTSFSGVASVSLPQDTFTSTYDNYRIMFTITALTADANLSMKFRIAGVDTSNDYYSGFAQTTAGGVVSARNTNGGAGVILSELDLANNFTCYHFNLDIMSPKITGRTPFSGSGTGITQNSSNFLGYAGGGFHFLSASFDSASFIASAGNISGKVMAYGYNQ